MRHRRPGLRRPRQLLPRRRGPGCRPIPTTTRGIDETWIREHCGSSATAEGVAQWQAFIEEFQGQGIGSRMMSEFLTWPVDAPMRLWVTDYNERAIRFYQRYGFKITGERELWRGKLPNVHMTRNATSSNNIS